MKVSELRDQVAVDYDALSASPKLQLEEVSIHLGYCYVILIMN